MSYSLVNYPNIIKSTGLTTIQYGDNKTGKLTYITFLEHPYVQKRSVILEKTNMSRYLSCFGVYNQPPSYRTKNSYSTIKGGYSSTAVSGYRTSKYQSLFR